MSVDVGYDLPWIGGPLKAMADKRLPEHGLDGPLPMHTLWDAHHFGLDRVSAFVQAPAAVREAVLADCARAHLLEAYFIEKAGVAYAAKMTLLAQTADERSLYALFCAEEATHLDAIHTALGPVDEACWQADPFLVLLQRIIAHGDRRTGQLIIQVVLEGWGLLHYATLRDDCRHDGLTTVLGRIVADEAAHHGSGVHLLRGATLDDPESATDLLAEMLAMVQVGPTTVASTLERHLGGFSRDQRRRVYEALDSDAHIRDRLHKLRGCLDKVPAARPITEALHARGRFAIPSVEPLA